MQNRLIWESIGASRYFAGERPILRPMKVSFALLAGLLLVGGLHTAAHASGVEAKDAQILGFWQRGEGEAIIEVRRNAGVYHGVIVSGGQRPETVGIEVFRELRYDAENGTWHGRAYSIKRKREVRIDIEVLKADQFELTAHIMIFTRRVEFKRIPDADVTGRQLADR